MAEETIFKGDNPEATKEETVTPVVKDTPTTFTIPTELQGLIGEGKKYATVEAALASVAPAQSHIATLETENKALKESVTATKTVQELIDDLRSTTAREETPSKVEVNQTDIAAIVAQELAKADKNKTKVQNKTAVAQRFIKQFGEKGEEKYNKLAAEAGLSVADLNILASTSPNAVFRMAGFDTQVSRDVPSTTNTGSVNSQALHGNSEEITTSKVKSFNTKDVKAGWAEAGKLARKNLGLD